MAGMNDLDIQELYRLARQKSVEGRTALAATVADFFSSESQILTPRERSLMFDILHRVVRDVEMSVRKKISEYIATTRDAPDELVNLIANDTIEVAYPVLLKSPVLKDSDLIEVIRNRTLEHQLAIAIRQDVSEAVSDALVERGNEGVICTLLKNPNARISKVTMEALVEQSRRVDTFREPILGRRELGPDLAKRMFLWVSAALRHVILEKFEIDADTVDSLLEKAVLEELQAAEADLVKPEKRAELAEALIADREITPELMVAILEEGEVALFVSVFKKMTGLKEKLVMRMLFEPGGEGLAIACRAVGLKKVIFTSIFLLSRKARPNLKSTAQRDLRRTLALFDQMTEDAARKVLRLWQRNAGYLAAIRELEISSHA